MNPWIYIPYSVGELILKYAGIYSECWEIKPDQTVLDLKLIPLPEYIAEIICDYVMSPEQVFAHYVLQTFYHDYQMEVLSTNFPGFITQEVYTTMCRHGTNCEYDHRALFKYNGWFVIMGFYWYGREDDVFYPHWAMNDYNDSPMDIVRDNFQFVRKLNKFEWADQNLREIVPLIKIISKR